MNEIELRQNGREFVGIILQEGRAATGGRAELFSNGSVEWPADGIDILPEHRAESEVKVIPERQDDGRISIRARATDALRRAYAEGRKYLSVEFHALREVRTQGGVREIQKAMVVSAAMVKNPEYNMAVAELSPNPPKSRGISAGAWVKDAARWRCGYDADAEAF